MPRMGGRPRRARRVRRRRRRRRVLLVGGLVAFGTYKFTQRDAERIEQHTGVDPEELDDAELEQARVLDFGAPQQLAGAGVGDVPDHSRRFSRRQAVQ